MAPYFSFAPDKRCGVLVVRGSERVDGGDEVLGALEARVVERFSLEDAKPDLNLVEPAGAGGREVKGDVRMRGEPVLVFLVGAQVVQDDVDLPVSGLVGNDLVHEGLKVGPLLDRKSTRLNSSH